MKLMKVLSGEERFEQHFTDEQRKRSITMCEIADVLYGSIRDGVLTRKAAAERAGVSPQTFSGRMRKAGY